MLALAAVADATGHPAYREAASAYATAAVAAHEPTPAAGDWKMGILADGIAAVHALTGADALRSWLVRYADTLLADPMRFDDAIYNMLGDKLVDLTKSRELLPDASTYGERQTSSAHLPGALLKGLRFTL